MSAGVGKMGREDKNDLSGEQRGSALSRRRGNTGTARGVKTSVHIYIYIYMRI